MSDTSLYQDYARISAIQYGLDPNIFSWQIGQESSWNPNASNGNAQGIAQFMPGTAKQYGVDPTNPFSSIDGAAAYMRDLLSANGGSYIGALQQYGTLANAPQSVWDSFQQAALGGAVPGTSNGGDGTAQDDNSCNGSPYTPWYWLCKAAQGTKAAGLQPVMSTSDAKAYAAAHPGQTVCGAFDLACWVRTYGFNLLVIVIGLILIVGAFMVYKKD